MNSVFSSIRSIGDFFISLKWAWQRATKGYCELDTYSVGDWLRSSNCAGIKNVEKLSNLWYNVF